MQKLTHEEHEARAMLMGMLYHKGNGMPFYYKLKADGVTMDWDNMLDANTLSPIRGQPHGSQHTMLTKGTVSWLV